MTWGRGKNIFFLREITPGQDPNVVLGIFSVPKFLIKKHVRMFKLYACIMLKL